MKISCDIIRDILPLYAEDLTSPASNEMVEEHLGECEGCKGYLDALRRPAKLPEQIPVENLKHIKKEIGKRRILSVLMAVCLVVSLFMGVQAFLEADIFLTADEAIDHIEPLEGGGVRVWWNPLVTGWGGSRSGEGPGNWGVSVSVKRGDLMFPEKAVVARDPAPHNYEDYGVASEDHDPRDNYWYISLKYGTAEKLLWDGGAPHPAPAEVLSNGLSYGLAWSCGVAGLFALIFALAAWLLRGSRAGRWIRYGALFCGGLCLSMLFASGGQFLSHRGAFHRKMGESWIVLIPVFLTGCFAFALWDMNHPLPARSEAQVRKELRCDKIILKVLIPVFLVIGLGAGIRLFMYAPIYLTAEEAAVTVETMDNGDLWFEYGQIGSNVASNQEDAHGQLICGFAMHILPHRLLGKPLERRGGSGFFLTKENQPQLPSYWYLNPKDSTADVLLWDNGTPKPEGPMMKRYDDLAWYCLGTGLGCILFLALAHYLPGKEKYMQYGTLICGSLCVAGLFISAGEFYVFEYRDMIWYRIANSLYCAVPLFLAGLCALKLRDLKKQDTP